MDAESVRKTLKTFNLNIADAILIKMYTVMYLHESVNRKPLRARNLVFQRFLVHSSSFEHIQAHLSSCIAGKNLIQIELHSEDAYLCKERKIRLINLKVLQGGWASTPIPHPSPPTQWGLPFSLTGLLSINLIRVDAH